MCYAIFISTTSGEDFSLLQSGRYFMDPVPAADEQWVSGALAFPNRWRLIGQYGGCSCHFRHMDGSDLSDLFPPADWLPEDADDIEATQAVYVLLERILAEGNSVDVVCIWNCDPPQELNEVRFALQDVPRESFQFLTDCRFTLSGR